MRSWDIADIARIAGNEFFVVEKEAEATMRGLETMLHVTYCPEASKRRFQEVIRGVPFYLSAVFAVVDDVKGKTILDIGCGSKGKDTYESKLFTYANAGRFEPWLARVLHHLGANVIGIDIGESPHEQFSFRQADFMAEPLPLSPHERVDIALCFNAISSPGLDIKYRHILGPTFADIAHTRITSELERRMPGSVFVHNYTDATESIPQEKPHDIHYHREQCDNCKQPSYRDNIIAFIDGLTLRTS